MPTRCHLVLDATTALSPLIRFGVLRRITSCAESRGVVVLAFAIDHAELRLVLDGPEPAVRRTVAAIRAGTTQSTRALDAPVRVEHATITPLTPDLLTEAVAWCHALAGGDPLASPWTSHRDLLGYRQASFFNAGPLRALVDGRAVHRLAGGRALPPRTGRAPRRRDLGVLLRVAAAVHGLLPADRRSFRLFVHLGVALGWPHRALARALDLTERRIRQLAQGEEPLLPLAIVHLQDRRLAAVP